MLDHEILVSLEFTPNPNTLKYSVNTELLSRGACNYTRKDEADAASPLASRLFEIPGISGVMIGKTFITVTKSEDGDWDLVHKSCSSIIQDHLTRKMPVVTNQKEEAHVGGGGAVEDKIREILDRDIRPAVAMDGGDITFEKFEAGIVYLYLQGSCAGCPSSTATLKMGIETRLKEAIPEVVEVVSV
jgi:Fe-S cluster biogenesis protein NfuA